MNWKIYGLKSKDNIIRYIGLTKRSLNKRLSEHKYYKNRCLTEWMIENNKEIFIVLIEDNINSLEEANIKEIFWIKFYKENLLNRTNGGDGIFGKKHSIESKKKISSSKKGKYHTEYTKNLMSITRKGYLNNMYNKNHSEETKKKISNSKKGKNINVKERIGQRKKVGCYIDDMLIKIYDKLSDVEKDEYSRISVSKCCRGIYKKSYGMLWKFMNG